MLGGRTFFTDINAKTICLIGNQSVAVLKEHNIRRHHETKHAAFSQFKGDARKNKTRELLAKLHRQQGSLTRPSTAQDRATRASFEINALITWTGRSFSTGDFGKECLSIAATIMCPSQAKTFSRISLSPNTVTRDIKEQFKAKAAGFVAFSLACDESTDISDSAQLLVFIRGDLFAAVEQVLDTNGLSWEKLVGIRTDGAPAMLGRKAGLASLISQKVPQCGGKVAKHHCILHQEQLCARSVGAINTIESALTPPVQSSSRGGEVDFFELRRVIAVFLTSKNSDTQVPTDENWFCDMAFMVDITDLLNTLNIQLQGKDQIITEPFDHITLSHFFPGNLAHFPSLREVNLVKQRLPEYAALLRHLDQDFALRFEDFRERRGVILTLFGSTYICEQTFNVMNLNKSRLRSTLTDPHLQDILTLSAAT
uniref:Transposase n=1 Tax=Denticeps clupeoides TaxID=299321 RepID=A0AAY4ARI4_9TELE